MPLLLRPLRMYVLLYNVYSQNGFACRPYLLLLWRVMWEVKLIFCCLTNFNNLINLDLWESKTDHRFRIHFSLYQKQEGSKIWITEFLLEEVYGVFIGGGAIFLFVLKRKRVSYFLQLPSVIIFISEMLNRVWNLIQEVDRTWKILLQDWNSNW